MKTQHKHLKILFLDIDFVLNSHKFEIQRDVKGGPYTPYYSDIDPKCITLLNEILTKRPNLKIVISSSWRADLSLTEFKKMFSHFGVDQEKIIDTTSSDMEKSKSIEKWVKDYSPLASIILDDDFLFEKDHPLYPNFYRVSTTGLTKKDLPEILKLI